MHCKLYLPYGAVRFLFLFPPFLAGFGQNSVHGVYKQRCRAGISFHRIGTLTSVVYPCSNKIFLPLFSFSPPILTRFGTWGFVLSCFERTGVSFRSEHWVLYFAYGPLWFFCPYTLQFSPNLDKIRHVISTANNVERTWVSLESVEWKPYFMYGPLWLFGPYLLQFSPDFNKIWQTSSTGSSVDRKWLSMKLVQWTPHFILSAIRVFVLIPSFSCPISTKFGTLVLQAIVLNGRQFL